MTEHTLTPNSSSPHHVIIVGWDSRIRTFFARVYRDAPGTNPENVLWEGLNTGEYTNATDIVDLVTPYTDTTTVNIPKLTDALTEDQDIARYAPRGRNNAATRW
ncbi:hypothetical protein [Amycolatopsis sp. cmx-4-54]|uniref:hypothetical protein n=1 Tax=Amycolatopsis sp. cmx-4-54 TaxID=2790936 RepID=UPI00397A8457